MVVEHSQRPNLVQIPNFLIQLLWKFTNVESRPQERLKKKIFWEDIRSTLVAFTICIYSIIWNGTPTFFWYDNWILWQAPRYLWPHEFCQSLHPWVIINELLELFRSFFPQLVQAIVDLSFFSFQRGMRNHKPWSRTSNWIFSVKYFYSFLINMGNDVQSHHKF